MPNEPKKPSEAPPGEPKTALPPAMGAEEGGNQLRRFAEEYERYAQAVQAASAECESRTRQAAQKLLQEQQDDMARAMSAEPSPSDSAWDPAQAQQRFVQEQREAWIGAQRRYEEAYRQYVEGLREAWPQGDLSGLDPGSLLTVGQILQAAGSLAQSTIGAWSLVGSWVTQPSSGAGRAA